MLKRIFLLVTLAIIQFGCGYEYGERFQATPLSGEDRAKLENTKRELLRLEDLIVGNGTIASWGRKVSAELDVRYVDGTIAYQGPAWTYYGFKYMPETSITDKLAFGAGQPGIILGLNGMAVGGKRRITIDRSLVCTHLPEYADPRAACDLIGPGNSGKPILVRKEPLVVEAALTESCVPIRLAIAVWPIAIDKTVACRDQDLPRLDPNLPIWHFY
jgi:hypothetical protein